MANLQKELDRLVEEFGLPLVYDTLRGFPGYCDNCGCPKSEGEIHSPANLGMCYIQTSMKNVHD